MRQEKPRFDQLKWLVIVILLLGAIVANYYFGQVAWAIRAAIGIVLIIMLGGIALQTAKGQRAFSFVKEARGELRKVVWPTRQETVQTTLIVVVMVIITALLLWGIDSLFMWAVTWLMGQRG